MDSRPWWKTLLHIGGKGVVEAGASSVLKAIGAAVLGISGVGTLVAAVKLHWDALLWSLAAMAVMAALLFFWNRHINGMAAMAKARANGLGPGEASAVTTSQSPTGLPGQEKPPEAVRVDGYVQAPTIEYIDADTVLDCKCVIDFSGNGLASAPSPATLRLTDTNENLIALLETKATDMSSHVTYTGKAVPASINNPLISYMGPVDTAWGKHKPGTQRLEVDIRLPMQPHLGSHLKSGVRLDFEGNPNGAYRRFTIELKRTMPLRPPEVAEAPSGVEIKRIKGGPIRAKAIGIIRAPEISYVPPFPNDPLVEFSCNCRVDFSGFVDGAKSSPGTLRLMDSGGHKELAILSAEASKDCPDHVLYTGRGRWSALVAAITGTLQLGTGPDGKKTGAAAIGDIEQMYADQLENHPPQMALPCNVEIHLPVEPEREKHEKKKVVLDFESVGQDRAKFTVLIPRFVVTFRDAATSSSVKFPSTPPPLP